MSLGAKVFTLHRFDRTDETLQTDFLRIREPEGYLELSEIIKRDFDVYGVFFKYAGELGFTNGLYDDLETGLQVEANAYDWLLDVYNEDGASAIVKLEIKLFYTNEVIYDLDLDFTKNGSPSIDPRNLIFSLQSSSRKPLLLTESGKKKIVVSNFLPIRMRQKNVEFVSECDINPSEANFQETSAIFVPPIQWVLTEFEKPFSPATRATIPSNPIYRFDEEATINYSFRIAGSVNYGIPAGNFNISIDFSLRDINDVIVYSNSTQVFVPAPTVIFNFDFTVSANDIPVQPFLFAHLRLGLQQNGLLKTIQLDTDVSEGFLSLTTLRFGSASSAILLKQSFQDVLDGLNQNFTLTSTIMDDLNDLGSIALTLGRLINPDLQPDINTDLALDFQSHFAECQKLFNLGYEINGNEIRIEDISYFFSDTVYILPNEITDLKIESSDTFVWGAFTNGYKTFKEKDVGKLNENQSFNSNRNYNLATSKSDKKLNVKTEYVASNFIVEKIRRDVNKTFDEKAVLLALNREEITTDKYSDDGSSDTYDPLEVVEGIEPFDIPSNDYFGLDKEGIINIRLSPRRLADRYVSLLRSSFYTYPLAEQEATFIQGDPKTELKINNIEENSSVDLTTQNGLFAPRKITLKTWFTSSQYEDLVNNHQKKTIQKDFKGITYQGFLSQIDYNKETRKAEVKLQQKFANV